MQTLSGTQSLQLQSRVTSSIQIKAKDTLYIYAMQLRKTATSGSVPWHDPGICTSAKLSVTLSLTCKTLQVHELAVIH